MNHRLRGRASEGPTRAPLLQPKPNHEPMIEFLAATPPFVRIYCRRSVLALQLSIRKVMAVIKALHCKWRHKESTTAEGNLLTDRRERNNLETPSLLQWLIKLHEMKKQTQNPTKMKKNQRRKKERKPTLRGEEKNK